MSIEYPLRQLGAYHNLHLWRDYAPTATENTVTDNSEQAGAKATIEGR